MDILVDAGLDLQINTNKGVEDLIRERGIGDRGPKMVKEGLKRGNIKKIGESHHHHQVREDTTKRAVGDERVCELIHF